PARHSSLQWSGRPERTDADYRGYRCHCCCCLRWYAGRKPLPENRIRELELKLGRECDENYEPCLCPCGMAMNPIFAGTKHGTLVKFEYSMCFLQLWCTF